MKKASIFLAVLVVVLFGAMALQAFSKQPGGAPAPVAGPIPTLQEEVDNLKIQVAQLQQQVAVLQNSPVQALAPYVSVVSGKINGLNGPHIIFTGANVHVRSGSGKTDDEGKLTGLGNLLVGYNRWNVQDRSGAHNLIVGDDHQYSSYGGLVAGKNNSISSPYSSVSGGQSNTASGYISSVSGGDGNTANGNLSSVSGGTGNLAYGYVSSVLGGHSQVAWTDEQTIPALP